MHAGIRRNKAQISSPSKVKIRVILKTRHKILAMFRLYGNVTVKPTEYLQAMLT